MTSLCCCVVSETIAVDEDIHFVPKNNTSSSPLICNVPALLCDMFFQTSPKLSTLPKTILDAHAMRISEITQNSDSVENAFRSLLKQTLPLCDIRLLCGAQYEFTLSETPVSFEYIVQQSQTTKTRSEKRKYNVIDDNNVATIPREINTLDQRLCHKFKMNWDQLQLRFLHTWQYALEGHSARHMVARAICCALSTGSRKSEILRNFASYSTVSSNADNNDCVHTIGTAGIREIHIESSVQDSFRTMLIEQIGVAKCQEGSEKRRIVKPVLFCTPEEVMAMIQEIRNSKCRSFSGDIVHCLLKSMFQEATALYQKLHCRFTFHSLRSLYANACFEMFHQDDDFNRCVFMAAVLGHGQLVNASLHYNTMRVQVDHPWKRMTSEQKAFMINNLLDRKKGDYEAKDQTLINLRQKNEDTIIIINDEKERSTPKQPQIIHEKEPQIVHFTMLMLQTSFNWATFKCEDETTPIRYWNVYGETSLSRIQRVCLCFQFLAGEHWSPKNIGIFIPLQAFIDYQNIIVPLLLIEDCVYRRRRIEPTKHQRPGMLAVIHLQSKLKHLWGATLQRRRNHHKITTGYVYKMQDEEVEKIAREGKYISWFSL